MAVYIKTEDLDDLLGELKDFTGKDKVDTWSYDSDGDFTHCAEQWKNRAWL